MQAPSSHSCYGAADDSVGSTAFHAPSSPNSGVNTSSHNLCGNNHTTILRAHRRSPAAASSASGKKASSPVSTSTVSPVPVPMVATTQDHQVIGDHGISAASSLDHFSCSNGADVGGRPTSVMFGLDMNNESSSPNRGPSSPCRLSPVMVEPVRTWHPHVYGKPPKHPTPHFIADILGWDRDSQRNSGGRLRKVTTAVSHHSIDDSDTTTTTTAVSSLKEMKTLSANNEERRRRRKSSVLISERVSPQVVVDGNKMMGNVESGEDPHGNDLTGSDRVISGKGFHIGAKLTHHDRLTAIDESEAEFKNEPLNLCVSAKRKKGNHHLHVPKSAPQVQPAKTFNSSISPSLSRLSSTTPSSSHPIHTHGNFSAVPTNVRPSSTGSHEATLDAPTDLRINGHCTSEGVNNSGILNSSSRIHDKNVVKQNGATLNLRKDVAVHGTPVTSPLTTGVMSSPKSDCGKGNHYQSFLCIFVIVLLNWGSEAS